MLFFKVQDSFIGIHRFSVSIGKITLAGSEVFLSTKASRKYMNRQFFKIQQGCT